MGKTVFTVSFLPYVHPSKMFRLYIALSYKYPKPVTTECLGHKFNIQLTNLD